ncbi:MAG: DUF4263 domain-containing protein [Cytophagia bacterium]|nr:MAG: DUF4263 domain-containing protein [Cytophagales bacterium]TAG34713.1 MAG: DUF4263 domain-containing protein [Cytophagia bacterium]TAG76808.1 MAG: DUF4263 domain-containing protein [Cytophagales bacterium]
MTKQPNPATLKLIKKKIDSIKKLEQSYWGEIDKQREKLSSIDSNLERKFEYVFPKNLFSLIYGCIDGAVIIRHSEINKNDQTQVQFFDIRLEKLLNELPIPYKDGRVVNFSTVVKLGVGSSLRAGKLKFGEDIEFLNFQIAVFKYSLTGKNEIIENLANVIDDIKLALLGMNFDIQHEEESTPKQERQSILDNLIVLKTKFDELLNTSSKEEELQVFLKEYPIVIQPYSKIFPKQKLGDDFITDFVITNTLEQGIKYTFVEIEKASMPIFTKNGEFTAEFNHANNQTLDWDFWLEQNIDYLRKKLIGLESPKFLIIAGRSTNFDDNNRARLRTWNRRQNNTEFLTFDDISVKLGELIINLQAVRV